MAVRTIYACDRCGVEVRRKGDLMLFVAELDFDIDKGSAGARDPISMEVCAGCGRGLMSIIRSAIENRAAVDG